MARMMFLNLPVTDLDRSKAFYAAVGAVNDPRFTDNTAACMSFSDEIHVMLLTHDKWRQFTDRQIVDAHRAAQTFMCVTADSRESVDAIVAAAVAAGGKPDPTPVDDYGWMYGRGFEDPDGHLWGINWMDMAAFEAARSEEQAA